MKYVYRFQLPWGQLEHLQLGPCSSTQFLSILKTCPKIEDLDVCLCGPIHIINPAPYSTIQHTRLTMLNIISYEDLSFLSDRVTFPSLRNLTLVIKGSWVQESFHSFLYRSSCSLRQLSIHTPCTSTDDIACILRRTPDLTELCFLHEVTNATLELLLVSSSAPTQILVPRLRCLSVNISGKLGSLVVVRVVESRWRLPLGTSDVDGTPVSRIERIVHGRDFTAAARARLSELAAEGLDVRVRRT